MKHKITKNWGLKLVSFLFAVMLWVIVTNINDPISPLRVYNIPVNIKNAELITDKGQIYEVLDGTDVLDAVTIRAPRSVIDTLDASNVIAEADMNDLTSLNTITIKLYTNKYNDKLESIKGNIDSVKLNIEDKQIRSFPIRPNVTGQVTDGYLVSNVSTDQNLIRVSGPQSVISQIAKAQAEVDISGFTSNIGTDSDIRLYNEDGIEIRSKSIEKSLTKVRVNVEILEKKTVPIVYAVDGTPAEGFRMTGEINSSKENVVIAGKSDILREISSIEVPERAIGVNDAVETVETVINLHDYLPENVILAEENFDGIVSVSVEIEQERRQTVYVPLDEIQLTGVPTGYRAVINEPEESYSIILVGLSSELSEVDINTIIAYIDVEKWLTQQENTEPESGYYRMPLTVRLPENSPVTWEDAWVNVHLTEIEE